MVGGSSKNDLMVLLPVHLGISYAVRDTKERSVFIGASGGKEPYTFELFSGHGDIESDTGFYTAVKQGNDRIRVTDFYGNTVDAVVRVSR